MRRRGAASGEGGKPEAEGDGCRRAGLHAPTTPALARLFLRRLTEKEPSQKKVACFTLGKARV